MWRLHQDGCLHLSREVVLDEHIVVAVLEGVRFGDHHVEDDAETEDVCIGAVLFIVENLWGHVTRSPASAEEQLVVLLKSSEAQINEDRII